MSFNIAEFTKVLREKVKTHYRFVVMNDDTFKERIAFKFTPLTIYVIVTISILILIFCTIALVAFTPLREYIPGYGSIRDNQQIRVLSKEVDSLQQSLEAIAVYQDNLKTLLLGKTFADDTAKMPDIQEDTVNAKFIHTKYDSLLLSINANKSLESIQLPNVAKKSAARRTYFVFFTPVEGELVRLYQNDHRSIDIACKSHSPVYATQSGVISCVSNDNTNNTVLLVLQHPDNILSIYRFSGMPSVSTGQLVKVGQNIAFADTNQFVNFELWINGNVVNPLDYISFE
ncbi:MAG: M23 family metallopeptidase [Bacteroidales bacterium]|jgi:murein DD-endopeptidase MepM/ murein hydrolase activator NlpD|nr:M23 family metallopeptidase [Bacteroidales bacterium]